MEKKEIERIGVVLLKNRREKKMNKLNNFEVTIKGTQLPTLMNRLSRELNEEVAKIPKDQRDEWEDKNYKKKLYGDENNIVVPSPNILGLMLECAKKYVVPPPKGVGKTWTNYFKGSLIVNDVEPLRYSKIKPFGTMVNGNPSNSKKSSKVYRVRPAIYDWELTFRFSDAGGRLTKDTLNDMLSNAGLFVGFGDWRPQYGRFMVKKVQHQEVSL